MDSWYFKSTLLKSLLNWKILGKTRLFVISSFCTHQSICLNIGFWYSNFVWKRCAFNLSILNWKTVLQFFEKGFLFLEKSVSKLKYWKTFKISILFHIKTCQSLSNRCLFWKSLVPFFRRAYTLSVGFKMKSLRKSIFQC